MPTDHWGKPSARRAPFHNRPVRLAELLDEAPQAPEDRRRAFGLVFPVLVSRPGAQVEQLETSTVYPIMTMQGHAPSKTSALDGEVARIQIGRTSESDIILDEETVSRRHATLVRHRGDRWSLVDEGGTNGTFVDGQRLEPLRPLELTGGLTTLRFGARMRLTFMYEDSFREFTVSFDAERRRARTPRPIKLPPSLKLDEPVAPKDVHTIAPPPARLAAKTTVFMRLPAMEYLIASILDRVRAAGAPAKRYAVILEGGTREEVSSWADLVFSVEMNHDKVEHIEAIGPDGSAKVVYDTRAGGKPSLK